MTEEYKQKLKYVVQGKTVVYIDAANLERSVQDMWVNPKDITDEFKKYEANKLCWRVDYRKFEKFFKEITDLQKINFYSANFDVEIAVDATFTLKDYDTFVLFSGDCDFEYLLKFLRGQNKITIVFSRSGHIARELPPACNHYFDIADFRNEILRMAQKITK